MSAPSSSADPPPNTASLRRLVQGVYLLQAASLLLALVGDGVVVTALVVALPATGGYLITRLRGDAARGTPLHDHFAWQERSFRLSAIGMALATLVLGPLVFVGLALLWFAYALIGLWLAWRIARGCWSLWRASALPVE